MMRLLKWLGTLVITLILVPVVVLRVLDNYLYFRGLKRSIKSSKRRKK
jgi:hypothetical protein